jgi:hypothetical protein
MQSVYTSYREIPNLGPEIAAASRHCNGMQQVMMIILLCGIAAVCLPSSPSLPHHPSWILLDSGT